MEEWKWQWTIYYQSWQSLLYPWMWQRSHCVYICKYKSSLWGITLYGFINELIMSLSASDLRMQSWWTLIIWPYFKEVSDKLTLWDLWRQVEQSLKVFRQSPLPSLGCLLSVQPFWSYERTCGGFFSQTKKNSVIFFLCNLVSVITSLFLSGCCTHLTNRQVWELWGNSTSFNFRMFITSRQCWQKKILAEMKANNSAHVCKIHKMHMD